MNTLNLQLGMRLKNDGLTYNEMHNILWMDRMRKVAKTICARKNYVTTDDLRVYANSVDDQPDSPNCWGAVLKGQEWVSIKRVPSELPSNHGRFITAKKWFPKRQAAVARVILEGK